MGYFSQLLLIAVSTAIVNNVVLSQFLGLCPFLGVSKKINTAAGLNIGQKLLDSVVSGLGTAVGFTIAIIIMAGIRERNEFNDVPESFKGMPIVLLTAGLMAIAFFGFSGII